MPLHLLDWRGEKRRRRGERQEKEENVTNMKPNANSEKQRVNEEGGSFDLERSTGKTDYFVVFAVKCNVETNLR
jgi:hypothetical protein